MFTEHQNKLIIEELVKFHGEKVRGNLEDLIGQDDCTLREVLCRISTSTNFGPYRSSEEECNRVLLTLTFQSMKDKADAQWNIATMWEGILV